MFAIRRVLVWNTDREAVSMIDQPVSGLNPTSHMVR